MIEPWLVAPAGIVVCEFGARLDAASQVAADAQFQQARQLYNAVIGCIRIVHTEMNAWVLERAGPAAQTLQGQLLQCEGEIATAKATANDVLDSALLAWKKSLALGRAPRFANGDRRDQDTLTLQFTAKGGLPVQQVLDGSSQELHLRPPTARAGAPTEVFDSASAWRKPHSMPPAWQYHRPMPEGVHVASASRRPCRNSTSTSFTAS